MSLVSNNDETILKGKSGATDEAETPKLFTIRPNDCIYEGFKILVQKVFEGGFIM